MIIIQAPVLIGASFTTLLLMETTPLTDASATLLFFFFAYIVFKSIWKKIETKDKTVEEKIDILYRHLVLKDCPHDNKK